MLRIEGLHAYYGRAHILHGVGLNLAAGEAVALLGRNGAGKSTTLRSIMGLVPRVEGRILLAEKSISGMPPHLIARRGVGYVPEERRIFAGLTVRENLLAGLRSPASGAAGWNLDRVLDLFPHLEGMLHRRGSAMSGGEQQMLAIARGLLGNPSLLLLDEPSEGLAPTAASQLAEALKRLVGEGLTVLLCEQNFAFAAAVCGRAYVLARGKVRHKGPLAAMAADGRVRAEFLAL